MAGGCRAGREGAAVPDTVRVYLFYDILLSLLQKLPDVDTVLIGHMKAHPNITTAQLDSRSLGDLSSILSTNIYQHLFPKHLELVPQLNEVYELELAFYESQLLSDAEIVRNGAYFSRVGDTLTRHFVMCSGEPVHLPQHSSSRLRSFFRTNQFKTGYATHGLFPYRGKFHPQMIKAILNVMGLKPGDTVLDPMMGSGTVLIEARLMGIKSVGIDASPFCRFMVQTKLDAFTLPLAPVRAALEKSASVFEHFHDRAARIKRTRRTRRQLDSQDLFSHLETTQSGSPKPAAKKRLPPGCENTDLYSFLLLAFLDSVGYSERSDRKSPYEQFRSILERYFFVSEKIQRVLEGVEGELAPASALEGDARQLPLDDKSMDGILFSPPYSFAIDYLENDAFHLNFLGADVDKLRTAMVGLRGSNLRDQFDLYKKDMDSVVSECARVLKPNGICTIVVGTNNNQLSKILDVPADEVQTIDELLVDVASHYGFRLVRKLERQITGMANTLRSEFIVILQRV